jgi:hypothetical protein
VNRYGVYTARYFTGPTGREIQAAGSDPVILGLYLGINEHATMIGLYELPLLFVEHELPVLPTRMRLRQAFRALATLPSGPFALYDEPTGHVWVPTLARIRLNLGPTDVLARRDKRHRAVVTLYENLAPNPYLAAFFDRYAAALLLPRRREASGGAGLPLFPDTKGIGWGSDAPSKPEIRSGSEIRDQRRPVETVETVENRRD